MTTETTTPQGIENVLRQARQASYTMATLPTERKNEALEAFARLIEAEADFLVAENVRDLEEQAGQIAAPLYQRLKLDGDKIRPLVQGIRDVVRLPDPVGRVLSKTRLDDGLVLEKRTVPLGVLAIIFESRPDVIPQILALALKSGNAVVLKGGKEAQHSNHAFMSLVQRLGEACPFLPAGWASLFDSREAVHEMLNHPQYVDLVIPRGSNDLVQWVMAHTRIPVLGHADGVCHLYLHPSADLAQALSIVLDAKTQYPSACNALETLLIDAAIAPDFLPGLLQAAEAHQITLKGCEATRRLLPDLDPVADWRTEYGDRTLAVKLVDGLEAAIQHINTHGSHHTDGILARDGGAEARFIQAVESANVFVNASTRFADGFRYGLGAEIGISTAKTHARGPVGLEGLVIYKYLLHGSGQIVGDYVGESAKPFQHQPMTTEE